MAYIPDNPDIYEYLTGIQYINFVCDIYGVGDERNEKIEKARSSIESTKKTTQWLSIQKKTAIADPIQMGDLLSREEEKNRRAEKNLKLNLKLLADLIAVSSSSQKQ